MSAFDPRLQAYLDGELRPTERAALEADLAADAALAADLDRLRRVNDLARHSALPVPPERLTPRIQATLAARAAAPRWYAWMVPGPRRPFTLLAWATTATTLLIALAGPGLPRASRDIYVTVGEHMVTGSGDAPEAPMPAALGSGAAAPSPPAMAAMPAPMPLPASPGGDRGGAGDGLRNAALDAAPKADAKMAYEAPSRAAKARRSVEATASVQPPARPTSEPLRAGETDDNQMFGKYLDYVRKYTPPAQAAWFDARERYTIVVTDESGRALADVPVSIPEAGYDAHTDAAGQAVFFPGACGPQVPRRVRLRVGQQAGPEFDRQPDGGIWRATLPARKADSGRMTLDVAFVLDTTGSMQDEINRLRDTVDQVATRIGALPNRPRLRLGLVLYRDHNDEYVTRTKRFTDSVSTFQGYLKEVSANAGGDTPEDVNRALTAMTDELEWSASPALRMAFLIGDAPPHLDYAEEQYLPVTQRAVARGIKVFALSTTGGGGSSEDDLREWVWRQVALLSRGRFLFITKGGDAGTTVHHVERQDYTVTALPDVVVQCVARELGALGKEPTVPPPADLGAPLVRPQVDTPPTPAPAPVLHDEPRPSGAPMPWRTIAILSAVMLNVAGWVYAWHRSRQPLASYRPMPSTWRWQPPADDEEKEVPPAQ